MTPDAIGPWAPRLDPAERLARLRSLRALVQVFAGSGHPLVAALAAAETDPQAAGAAWETLEGLTPRQRRTVLASLTTLQAATPRAAAGLATTGRKRAEHG